MTPGPPTAAWPTPRAASRQPADAVRRPATLTPVEQATRGKWTVFAALLAVLAVTSLVVLLAGGGSSEGESYELTLEQLPAPQGNVQELVVSVPREVNAPSVARNQPTVELICEDGRGKQVLRARQEWPFINEEGYELPHQHQAATPQVLTSIARCRLKGTTIPLSGELGLRG